VHTGLDGGCGPVARRPRRHDQGEGRKVKGRKILKCTYVNLFDVIRAAHNLRQGGCRKSSSERCRGEVGHCLVVGQGQEWDVGRCPGRERCRRVAKRRGGHSNLYVIMRVEWMRIVTRRWILDSSNRLPAPESSDVFRIQPRGTEARDSWSIDVLTEVSGVTLPRYYEGEKPRWKAGRPGSKELSGRGDKGQ
jgi:hypothetical protein